MKRQLAADRLPAPIPQSYSAAELAYSVAEKAVPILKRQLADAALDHRKAGEPLIGMARYWLPSIIRHHRALKNASTALSTAKAELLDGEARREEAKAVFDHEKGLHGLDIAAERVRRERSVPTCEEQLRDLGRAAQMLLKEPGLARLGTDGLLSEMERRDDAARLQASARPRRDFRFVAPEPEPDEVVTYRP